MTAECSICLTKQPNTKSIYEKVKNDNIAAEKYLPEVIEYISGVQLTKWKESVMLICGNCIDDILQAEMTIQMCKANLEARAKLMYEESTKDAKLEQRENKHLEEIEKDNMKLEYGETTTDIKVRNESSENEGVKQRRPRTQRKAEQAISQEKHLRSSCNNHESPIKPSKRKAPRKSKSKALQQIENCAKEATNADQNIAENEQATPTTAPSTRKYIRTVNKNKEYFFRCDHCNYTSHFATYYRKHLQQTHNLPNPRIFKCSLCPKDFLEYRYLQQHIAHDHQNQPKDRTYLCAECGLAFAKSSNLTYHQRTHLSKQQRATAPSVQCKYCAKEYSQHSIRMHVLSVHAVKRSHCCELCGAAFAVRKSLQAHMRTCHPAPSEILRCPCCEVKFRVKSVYEAHVQRGGCQKLGFNCDYCAWGFKSKERLEKHKLNVHKNLLHLEFGEVEKRLGQEEVKERQQDWQVDVF